jgi:hypothetical protein
MRETAFLELNTLDAIEEVPSIGEHGAKEAHEPG